MENGKLPILSVIMISYNEREYLNNAIASCLNQSLSNIEIIIGDDGSLDGSIDIIQEYERQYPNIIRTFVMERPNKGEDIIPSLRVSNIIKKGLALSRGRYIVILSGDDFFCESNKFKQAVSYLENHKEYAAVVSAYQRYYPDGTREDCCEPYPIKLFWSGRYLHISSFVFRKAVYEKGLLLKRFCDDTGLIYSIARDGKWKYSNKVTFAYRQREKSIVHSADLMELSIVELMLFQDILCKCDEQYKSRLRLSTYSRFAKPLKYVWEHREELPNYQKYLKECDKYDHNILKELVLYNRNYKSRMKLNCLLLHTQISRICFCIARIIYKLCFI